LREVKQDPEFELSLKRVNGAIDDSALQDKTIMGGSEGDKQQSGESIDPWNMSLENLISIEEKLQQLIDHVRQGRLQ